MRCPGRRCEDQLRGNCQNPVRQELNPATRQRRSAIISKIIAAGQTELDVKDWDTGQPVILIHGWPLSSDIWDDQAMALAQAGYRVIAHDRCGSCRDLRRFA